MTDLTPGEVVYVACVCKGRPESFRARFVRPARAASAAAGTKTKAVALVLSNDKGTDVVVPIRYVFKTADDALQRAEKMVP